MEELFGGGFVAHVFEEGWIPKWLIANGRMKRRNCVVVEEGNVQEVVVKWKICACNVQERLAVLANTRLQLPLR